MYLIRFVALKSSRFTLRLQATTSLCLVTCYVESVSYQDSILKNSARLVSSPYLSYTSYVFPLIFCYSSTELLRIFFAQKFGNDAFIYVQLKINFTHGD